MAPKQRTDSAKMINHPIVLAIILPMDVWCGSESGSGSALLVGSGVAYFFVGCNVGGGATGALVGGGLVGTVEFGVGVGVGTVEFDVGTGVDGGRVGTAAVGSPTTNEEARSIQTTKRAVPDFRHLFMVVLIFSFFQGLSLFYLNNERGEQKNEHSDGNKDWSCYHEERRFHRSRFVQKI